MPDRAIIPLLPALALGFICGIISSALLLGDGGVLAVGVAGAIVVAIAATSSVFGVKGDSGEKTIVAGIRAALAVATYAMIFLFILGFLRDGSKASVVFLVFAIFFAIVLSRLRVRERGEIQKSESTEAA